MSRRLSLLAAGILAAGMMVAWEAGCTAPAQKQQAADAARPGKPIDFAAMPPALRLLAAEAAGPRAAGAVAAVTGLLADKSFAVRAEAGQTLGTWAGAIDSAIVLPALTSDDAAVRGLAQAGYIDASPYGMAPLVVQGGVIEVPVGLVSALAQFGERAGLVDIDAILNKRQDALRAELDGSPETAVLAADLLARITDVGARRTLIRLIEMGDSPVLTKAALACARPQMGLGPTLLPLAFNTGLAGRRAVMAAMVTRPDPRLKDVILKGLGDADPAVRHNAIRALGNLGGATPVSVLAAKLNDPAADRADVIRALGAIGRPGADALRQFLQQPAAPDDLQVLALVALAPAADRDDVPWISKRLAAPNKLIRAAAASALGRIGNPTAQAALMQATGDTEPLVRAAVAKALGQLGTVYASEQLLVMLNDSSPLVVAMAAWGLGETSYDSAAPALAGIVKGHATPAGSAPRIGDLYGWPELAAAEALGRIGTPEAVAALVPALQSKAWLMRATAAEALGAAGQATPEVVAALEKLLKDPVSLVRGQALVSLNALGKTYTTGQLRYGF